MSVKKYACYGFPLVCIAALSSASSMAAIELGANTGLNSVQMDTKIVSTRSDLGGPVVQK